MRVIFRPEAQAEAVEAIRRVQEASPDKLVSVEMAASVAGFERYIRAGEFCQWRLAALARLGVLTAPARFSSQPA